MTKYLVSKLSDLHKDFGEDGDVAQVAEQNTEHIFPSSVTYTKVNGKWLADKWYVANNNSTEP